MTKHGIIKTFIIIILTTLGMISGPGVNTHYSLLIATVPPFFLGFVVSLVIGGATYFIKGIRSSKPKWNDSMFTFRMPLSFLHFFGYLLVTLGISRQITQWFQDYDYSQVGIPFGTLGIGLLVGIELITRLKKDA